MIIILHKISQKWLEMKEKKLKTTKIYYFHMYSAYFFQISLTNNLYKRLKSCDKVFLFYINTGQRVSCVFL